jgi:glycosyltransferase involved in cell wall biosynthesis
MRVLQINASADTGGAGLVMYRLHHELIRQGHSSQIVARLRQADSNNVHTIPEITGQGGSAVSRATANLRMQLDEWFALPAVYSSTGKILESDLFRDADLVQLHNLHGWYFDYRLLPRLTASRPVVWTLHDMWALTGHCGYAYGCERWKTGCFDCPLLTGDGRRIVEPRPTIIDRTSSVWHLKHDLYSVSGLHIVAPSRWLAGLVPESILADALSVQCIPNGVDLDLFRPVDQATARATLRLPLEGRIVLFVAATVTQGRKGLPFLLDALRTVQSSAGIVLLTIGDDDALSPHLVGFEHSGLGKVSDESVLNLAYNAADLFVTPTLADNQPLVVIEALATGTPTVAFDVGGLSEMVNHLETGYLARPQDAQDLAKGIQLLLEEDDLRLSMQARCRIVAEERYGLDRQARRYLELYAQARQQHSATTV